MLIKRAFQISVLAITFAVTAAVSATAQSYPTQPITIIVPFPPGGNSDLVIRYLADRLSVSLNQPVIVENRAGGAGGTVGTRAFVNANPNGYTLLFIPPAPLVRTVDL
jgi:tripartite-type tricarboxylate transporter receptor subunit TctC